MVVIRILIFLFLVFSNTADIIDGYCDSTTKICKSNEKYILYDVNPPEGFNLRRDVYMRFAIMLSEARKKNWNLILPPWYNLYHWKTRETKPIPWNKFFDLKSLKSFAPVLELYELFDEIKSKPFNIDRLYVLENFPDPFEDGDFRDKWEINSECNYDGSLWGYNNITVTEKICVKFQGKISKLWELIALHPSDTVVMFVHGEIPLHDSYGTKKFWDCRKSMKFNDQLIKTAKKFIKEHFNCTKECKYLSVHWRRQDFARSRRKDVPTLKGTVKQIDNAIKKDKQHIKDVFIASDGTKSELNELEKHLKHIGYKVHIYKPSQSERSHFKDGGIAIIDQLICSQAQYFIGTYESTFTYRIQEEREILGFDSSTTFNRLCPDSGKCEKPSVWNIIN